MQNINKNAAITPIQLDKAQQNELNKKVQELMTLCMDMRVPVFICYVKENSDEGTQYKAQSLDPYIMDIVIKDDKFAKFVNVINNFETIPPSTEENMMAMSFDSIQ